MSLPFYTWTPAIVTHTALAAFSLVLGAALLWGRKGHRTHRLLGWLWVLCMAGVATMSFAIQGPDGFSWIHGLSAYTLLSLASGVYFARTHRVQIHRYHMVGLYAGALVITGLFTLLPGRLIGHTLWTALN